MFTRNPEPKDEKLEEAINRLFSELDFADPEGDDYPKILASIKDLYSLKPEKPKRISPDTMAIVAGNLLGIVMILKHEQVNAVASKALGFVLKSR